LEATYKTTIQPKLNRTYARLLWLNPFSQSDSEDYVCDVSNDD